MGTGHGNWSFEELCLHVPEANKDQMNEDLVQWIQEAKLERPLEPSSPKSFIIPPVYGGQLGVPPIINALLNGK